MKVIRSKFVRKYLRFYRLVFGIDPPFRVLLDANFIFHCLKYKIDIQARLENVLQEHRIEIFVLRSGLRELNGIGDKGADALKYAQECCSVIEDCKKRDKALASGKSESQALTTGPLSFLKQCQQDKEAPRYFVATQDTSLRTRLGALGGVPLLYVNKVSMILEAPSEASKQGSAAMEAGKAEVSTKEASLLQEISKAREEKEKAEKAKSATRLKRKASAPNPLSCREAESTSQNSIRKKKAKFMRTQK